MSSSCQTLEDGRVLTNLRTLSTIEYFHHTPTPSLGTIDRSDLVITFNLKIEYLPLRFEEDQGGENLKVCINLLRLMNLRQP